MMDPKRHNIYWGIDFVWTKRLSHKWMASGSITYQDQRSYFGDNGYTDPTNLWASEGQLYAFDMGGGSGKINRPFFTRWMFKLQGLYQLPSDLTFPGRLGAPGHLLPDVLQPRGRRAGRARSHQRHGHDQVQRPDPTAATSGSSTSSSRRCSRSGTSGKMYFSADLFNSLNLHTIMRKEDIGYGTFYYLNRSSTAGPRPTPRAASTTKSSTRSWSGWA